MRFCCLTVAWCSISPPRKHLESALTLILRCSLIRLTTGMDRECVLFLLLFFTLMNKIASMRSIKKVMIKDARDWKGQFSHKWKPRMTYGTNFMVILHPFLKLDRASFHWLSLYGKKQPGYTSEIEQKIESHMGLEKHVQSTVNGASEMDNLLKIYFNMWQARNLLFIFKFISYGFKIFYFIYMWVNKF